MTQTFFGSFEGDWFEVCDQTQARLLTHPESLRLLEPFIGFERSATQAAQKLGCSVERLLYRIKQFEQSGLLRETRREPRAGRPIRYFRTVADGFRIPFRLTPFADLEALIAHQSGRYDRLRHRAGARNAHEKLGDGRIIYREASSGELCAESASFSRTVRGDLNQKEVANDVADIVNLEPGQARMFANELNDLYKRIQAARRPDGKGKTFLLQFSMVALAPEDVV